MIKTILVLIVSIIFGSCIHDTESSKLEKVTRNELALQIENFSLPQNLDIRNQFGDIISIDSLRRIYVKGEHAFDYYKNSTGDIVECKIRKHTKEDSDFEKYIRSTKVVLTEPQKRTINKLATPQSKSTYLKDLWTADQNLRQGQGAEIELKYGQGSPQHNAYRKESIKNNGLIFMKIKYYLETHGYPKDKAKYHELALNAFPTIIGHNGNYDEQHELIQHLYKSYKEGYCDLGEIVWIMGEMHERKYDGKRYEMKSNKFTGLDEFNELNNVLGLGFQLNTAADVNN